VRLCLDAIELRGRATEELLADFQGLRTDGLREGGETFFPGNVGQAHRPFAAEHEALGTEDCEGVLNKRADGRGSPGKMLDLREESADFAEDVWEAGGRLHAAEPVVGGAVLK